MKILNYQELEFYSRLFKEYEEGPFEVLTGFTKVGVIRKIAPSDPNVYVFQEINSACVFCSFNLNFIFLRESCSISFKYAILPYTKSEDRLKLSKDLA